MSSVAFHMSPRINSAPSVRSREVLPPLDHLEEKSAESARATRGACTRKSQQGTQGPRPLIRSKGPRRSHPQREGGDRSTPSTWRTAASCIRVSWPKCSTSLKYVQEVRKQYLARTCQQKRKARASHVSSSNCDNGRRPGHSVRRPGTASQPTLRQRRRTLPPRDHKAHRKLPITTRRESAITRQCPKDKIINRHPRRTITRQGKRDVCHD